jgi:hypothetical protein
MPILIYPIVVTGDPLLSQNPGPTHEKGLRDLAD